MSKLKLGGHRGLGCTDHAFFQGQRDIASLPVENTLTSIKAAFETGADYIETDAVMSKDGVIFTLHNVVPQDHFFGPDAPTQLLNHLNFAEIKQAKTGRHHNGEVATMIDMLNLIAQLDPGTLPWAVNIEIKGVQGSGQNYETNAYLHNLTETVRQSKLPASRILWSSFSLENILKISHSFEESQFGMLLTEKPEPRAIFTDHVDDPHYQFLPFDKASVDLVTQEWKSHAHSKTVLKYLHPEIQTINQNMIDIASDKSLAINSWALFEEFNATRVAYYKEIIDYAKKKNVPFTAITDYLDKMKAL